MSKPFKPHPYQLQMIEHIIGRARCALWVFMGGGKSVSTLTALDILSLTEDDVYPALVLAPLRVAKTTWPEEVKKWDHLKHVRVRAIVGSETERHLAARAPAEVYTCNYENLPWLVAYWGDNWPYKTIVADESTKLKSFRLRQGGSRAQALGKVAHRKAKRFIELTGTCAPNGLNDLWGQMWFLDIGERLGRTYDAFKSRWFQRSYDGYGVVPLDHAQKQIQDALRDVCLTIKAEDWFDLRAPIVQNVMVDLPIKARKHYAEMEKEMYTQLTAHAVEAFGAAERTLKCLQLCIAGGTEVLTSRGWVAIENVARADMVWDGHEWAPHGGVIRQGEQEVVDCFGVHMTEQHKVLMTVGWLTAKEIGNGDARSGFVRQGFWLPDGTWSGGNYTRSCKARDMEGVVRVREHGSGHRAKPTPRESGREEVMRVSERGDAGGCLGHSRHDAPPSILVVGGDAPTLLQRRVQRLRELRRAGHNCLRKLAGVIRAFLAGHGCYLGAGVERGPNRQQRRVHARELPLGHPEDAREQHQGEHPCTNTSGAVERNTTSGDARVVGGNAPRPAVSVQVATGKEPNTPCTTQTFDIADVGRRNQFVVRGPCGMLIVHNCSGALYTSKDEWEVVHDEKVAALESIIEEAGGEPVLVAYHFKSDLARLKKHFPKGRHLDKSPQTITDWNDGKIPLMFAHPQSAGHGLNLQYGGRILVYFSHWWALEDRLQIAERIGPVRQLQAGFDRNVFIYNLIARDTVDELVIARNDEKKSVQDILIDAMRRKHLL